MAKVHVDDQPAAAAAWQLSHMLPAAAPPNSQLSSLTLVPKKYIFLIKYATLKVCGRDREVFTTKVPCCQRRARCTGRVPRLALGGRAKRAGLPPSPPARQCLKFLALCLALLSTVKCLLKPGAALKHAWPLSKPILIVSRTHRL